MKYIPFDFDWKFSEGNDRFFMFAGANTGEIVDLPHDYIIGKPRDPKSAGGASTGFYPGGAASYTKNFALTDDMKGKTVLLDVDGAYMNSEVTLNGDLINLHPYGYSAYTVNLTPKLRDENNLRISTKCTQPNSRWYSGAGLYRQVGLLVGGETYVHPWDVFVTTPIVSADSATINAAFEISGKKAEYLLKAEIIDNNGVVCASASAENCSELIFTVDKPRLWNVDDANMYILDWSLCVGGEVADVGSVRFGIRKIEIDAQNGFRLNGNKMKLRGGCIHHDNAMLGACAYPAAERRKIEKLKKAGYNAVRTAHNPPSTALLDACDEIGMLVLDESFDMWRSGKNAMDYHLWFEDWWQRDTASMVKRDRNHPCVYSWSIGNEVQELLGTSDGAHWAQIQADYVRSLDSTRPISASANGFTAPRPGKPRKPHDLEAELTGKAVIGLPQDGEDEWGEQTLPASKALDIFGYNYLYGRYAYDKEKFPDRVIHATETHAFRTYGYWKACVDNENCIGDYIWTAYDNLGEAGAGRVIYSLDEMKGGLTGGWPWLSCYQGDLDLIGDARPQNVYRNVMWGLDKGVHIFTTHPMRTGKPFFGMGWHWEDIQRTWKFGGEWLGSPVKVQAYADCDEVQLFLNDEFVGKAVPEEYKVFFEIPYTPGRIEARALRGGEVTAVDVIETTGEPCRIALSPERSTVNADGMDVAYVRAEVVDEMGRVCRDAEINITARVTGAGKLLAVGSGNPCTEENFTDSRKTFNGTVMICARAGREPGGILIEASADGLAGGETSVNAVL